MILSTYLDEAQARTARLLHKNGISIWDIAAQLKCTSLAVEWVLIDDREPVHTSGKLS